ncbi:hypothetical protein NIES970_20190 [[Synechococcus] sp. NIES-970]|uniref:hypothetical protein n=1 Tax=Picosynechococcus sp. NKBG15041c TaxID=1407650 RepID=UPI0004630813|nr:hypothetical protein [Picosynechococcus sp. NKBG15041c]BAW97074.1 hypothetical protein NIES970_20190 [[Synechococcus] sp. NIES-970]
MAKKFGWSPAIPYPLAWLRLLINFVVLGVAGGFFDAASRNRVLTVHPLFVLFMLVFMGGLAFGLHYLSQWILVRLEGIRELGMIDSLWEAVLLVMVTVNSLFLVILLCAGTYIGAPFVDPETLEVSNAEIAMVFIMYSAIALYLYHLEYLVRHPEVLRRYFTPPEQRINLEKKPPKTELTPETRKREVDLELARLKARIENEKRFGK